MSITIYIFPIIHHNHLIQNSKHIKQLSPTCSAVFHVSIPSPLQKNNGKTFPLACSLGTFGLWAQHHEPELSELQEWFHMELGFTKSHGDSKSRNALYVAIIEFFLRQWKPQMKCQDEFFFRIPTHNCLADFVSNLLHWWNSWLQNGRKPWATQADCSRCVSGEIREWDTPHAQGFPARNNMGFTLVLPTCLSKSRCKPIKHSWDVLIHVAFRSQETDIHSSVCIEHRYWHWCYQWQLLVYKPNIAVVVPQLPLTCDGGPLNVRHIHVCRIEHLK